ncbi:hypothetical protein AYI69_g554 [Smittium culicis]|uniref:Uncharacterized protein n=1 Tax=Smittium culicis TaxID=133412 RepID=A0A1R1YSP7_9FUNG|nr:hypothetical protein AYI69_g3012 [Smittium culicis]OMJ29914.1 hypothetical protein AYI69_g554 [Smittium culicis]
MHLIYRIGTDLDVCNELPMRLDLLDTYPQILRLGSQILAHLLEPAQLVPPPLRALLRRAQVPAELEINLPQLHELL